jgi:CHAT domain-containing protein
LAKLEHSLKEADAITAIAPPGSWMKAVGFKASRAMAMSPALRQFRIVHFATHGILNDKHPELSGIVLSMVDERGQPEDGYLTLRDISNLDLPVDLVVLSACQTGIGKPVRGEGLLGLTRGFMYAGAPRVVASLWSVDDEATAELMKRFYRHMLGRDRMSAAAALRRAKIEMMGANDESRAPYYWAGFILQGDWK